MLETLWNQIYEFKEFLCVSAAVMTLFAMVLPFVLRRFDFRKGNVFGYYLFGLRKKEAIVLSIAFLEVLFVISAILFEKAIDFPYLFVFLFMQCSMLACFFQVKRLFFALVHALLLFVGLLVANVMYRYLMEIKVEMGIVVLYIFLNLFLILYSIYLFFEQMVYIKMVNRGYVNGK